MAYMELMGSTLSSLVAAGQAGRTSLDGMLGPLNGAVRDMTGAASELESLPIVGPMVGEKLQRTMRQINAAQSAVGQVAAKYNQAVSAASQVQQRLGTLKEQAAKAGAAINRMAGKLSPSLGNIFPSSVLGADMTPAAEAVKPFPHLLIIQPQDPKLKPYYFNLDTAAFDELTRKTAFRWAGQERLTREIAQQAVGHGEDKLTIKGAIFPLFRGGIGQLNELRSIGRRLQPLTLTTGYGEVLGTWCLLSVDEDQGALLPGGIPRKQGFNLEFVAYGNDMQNV
ncbi:phage tail protein [Pseudomonas asiatica]|uniref:phage tail protein n=1 Tax=Pseudomonas asiatica TaxID=2219225 RepID=UPI00209B91D4|nr:phage tail protein [Pseudomonas asiatica]MCO7537531.1 phage tail protein [Pseudomonas asiatica]MCO7551309.1 phage tail protein [Pseudomonas asiatica]MCO7561847.1 phage tail protein [Pseudomonas asiatica]